MRLVYSFILLPLSLLFSLMPKVALAVPPSGQVATVQEVAGELGKCFYCGALDTFLQSASLYLKGNGVDSPLISQSDALLILGISLGLWLLFHSMKTVFQLTGAYREYFLGLVQRFFAVIIAAGFISAGFSSLSEIVIEPAIEFSAGIGLRLLAVNHGGGNNVNTATCGLSAFAPQQTMTAVGPVNFTPMNLNGFFSQSFMDTIGCLVKEMDANIMPGRVIAAVIISYSYADINLGAGGMISFALLIAGCLLMIPYIYLTIFVPFVLMDPLLKIVMVGILFPLFVIAWVFPSTRSYSVMAFELLMFSCMELLAASFIIGMLTRGIQSMLNSVEINHYIPGAGLGGYVADGGVAPVKLYQILDTSGGAGDITAFDLAHSFANWNNILMFKVLVASLLLCYVLNRSQHVGELLANDGFSHLNSGSVLSYKMKGPATLVKNTMQISAGVVTAPYRGVRAVSRGVGRAGLAYTGAKMAARNTYAAGKGAAQGIRTDYRKAKVYYRRVYTAGSASGGSSGSSAGGGASGGNSGGSSSGGGNNNNSTA